MRVYRETLELACLNYSDENEEYGSFFDAIKELKTIELEGIGEVQFLEETWPEGGYDDDRDGEHIDVVFKVGEQYFRKAGHYNSWDSHNWDGAFEEVQPAKVQRTIWKNINERG